MSFEPRDDLGHVLEEAAWSDEQRRAHSELELS